MIDLLHMFAMLPDANMRSGLYCCLPIPLTLVCVGGGSPIITLLVHQPAYPSIWVADPSPQRGLSTNPGVYVGAVEEMMCVVFVDITEGA